MSIQWDLSIPQELRLFSPLCFLRYQKILDSREDRLHNLSLTFCKQITRRIKHE